MYNVAVLHSLLYSHYVCVCARVLACLVGGLKALVADYSLRQSLVRLILALVYTKSSSYTATVQCLELAQPSRPQGLC